MKTKVLKSYKGMIIEKSYETHTSGKINKDSIVYTAYTEDNGVFDATFTLKELKKRIDSYVK